MGIKRNLVGQTFGRLQVLREVGRTKHHCVLWEVRCSCGVLKTLGSDCLRKGRVSSCGCLRNKRPYEGLYNRAKLINVDKEFLLTYEEFLTFVGTKRCHYCFAPISWAEHRRGLERGCRYNLDRMDNARGYVFDNLVVCCFKCNRGKGNSFTYAEWWGMTEYFRRQRCQSH